MKSQDQFWNWLRNRKQTSCTCYLPQHWTEHSVAWTFLESAKSPKIEIYYIYSEKASRFSTLTTLYKRIKNKTIIWSYQIIAVGSDRIWNLDSETKSIRQSLLAPSTSFHVLLYPDISHSQSVNAPIGCSVLLAYTIWSDLIRSYP